MTITTLPTRGPTDLGAALSNTRAPAANELSAVNVEKIKDRIIEVMTDVGLTDGSTASSVWAAVKKDPPTANADLANKKYVDQVPARSVSGTTDTIVAGDIGGVVFYSQAGGVEAELPDLSASATASKAQILTFQGTDAATVITVDPGSGVTIDGSTSSFVGDAGRARISLMAINGKDWFSGTP